MKLYPIALTLFAALTWGVACSSTTTPAPGDGDGDGDMSSTGGKPGSGGGGGTGGAYECDPEASFAPKGGAVGWNPCFTGNWEEIQCGGGGAGGAGGAQGVSILRAICEAPTTPGLWGPELPASECLMAEQKHACEPGRREAILDCLREKAPCDINLKDQGCTPYLDACSELTPSTCIMGLTAVSTPEGREIASDCFAEEVVDENCEDRFFRCVYGIE